MKQALLTTGLVVALLLSMTVPASAVSMETLPNSVADSVEGITETPENTGAVSNIEVKTPEKVEFILNPYRLVIDTPHGFRQDEVISKPQTIISRTPLPLSVMVSATATTYGGVSFAVSPEDFNPDTKSAFLWIEFQTVADGEEPVWSGEYTGTRNQVILNGESRPVLELPASRDGEPVQALFRIFGAAGVPSEGMWTADDGVDVSLSFEFEVIEDDEATLYGEMFIDTPPEVSDIAEPVEDEESFIVAEPVEYAEPSDNEEPVEDAALSDVVEPVEDEESFIVAEPVEYVEMSDNEELVEYNEEPVEDAALSNVVDPVEDEEAFIVAEPVEYVEMSDNEEPVEYAELSDVVEPVEDAESFVVAQPVEYAELSDNEEPVEDAGLSDVIEPVEDEEAFIVTQPVEYAEPSDNEALSDVVEPVEDEESFIVAEPVEDEETSDNEEPVEDAALSDVVEPVEDGESSDVAEPTEYEEASNVTEPVGNNMEINYDATLSFDAPPAKEVE